MSNHVHLVAVPATESGLARAIGEAHRRCTRAVNFRENWRGYLWQGRFASCPMDERYLLAAVRYVELNPVRAGLVGVAWEHRWSSAAAHVTGKDDRLVMVKPMLERVADWKGFLSDGLKPAELRVLREHNRTGRPLGSDEFLTWAEQVAGRGLGPRDHGSTSPRAAMNLVLCPGITAQPDGVWHGLYNLLNP